MRDIIDREVQDRIYKWSSKDYEAITKTYAGQVNESVEKSLIHTSEFGLIPVRLTNSLERMMDHLKPEAEDCTIFYFGKQFHVAREEMCMLKALASFQISKSEVLSEVVSNLFAQLLPQIAQGKGDYALEPMEGYGQLQINLHNMLADFVVQKLGRKRKEVVN